MKIPPKIQRNLWMYSKYTRYIPGSPKYLFFLELGSTMYGSHSSSNHDLYIHPGRAGTELRVWIPPFCDHRPQPLARWSQHHGPFSCRCTSPKKNEQQTPLGPSPRKWTFFFQMTIYVCFWGQKFAYFQEASSLVSGRVSVKNNLSKR